ncbi:hypothetical protein ACTFIT_009748 [Dictyostelium discoideum]
MISIVLQLWSDLEYYNNSITEEDVLWTLDYLRHYSGFDDRASQLVDRHKQPVKDLWGEIFENPTSSIKTIPNDSLNIVISAAVHAYNLSINLERQRKQKIKKNKTCKDSSEIINDYEDEYDVWEKEMEEIETDINLHTQQRKMHL